jgi:hypothetical protein
MKGIGRFPPEYRGQDPSFSCRILRAIRIPASSAKIRRVTNDKNYHPAILVMTHRDFSSFKSLFHPIKISSKKHTEKNKAITTHRDFCEILNRF